MGLRYYDRDGRQISRIEWQRLDSQPGYCRVDYTSRTCHGFRVTVVTCWLGVTGDQRPGPPLIFRTYGEIRPRGDVRAACRRVWGWPGLEAARAGHRAVTSRLIGHASQPPAPPVPVGGHAASA